MQARPRAVGVGETLAYSANIEECREMLRDALNEMVLAYQQQEKEIPHGNCLIEQTGG